MSLEINIDVNEYYELRNLDASVYSPLRRLVNKENFLSILNEYKLTSGEIFPLPIALDVDRSLASKIEIGKSYILRLDNRKIGSIVIDDVYSLNKLKVCKKLFGTDDPNHGGVKKYLSRKEFFLGGEIKLYNINRVDDQCQFLHPKEAKEIFKKKKWKTIAGFQTRNIPHRAHEHLLRTALEYTDGLFVNPLVGFKKRGDFRSVAIFRSYEYLLKHFFPLNKVFLGPLYASMWYAGPREAVFHAIIRRNYGCTHFIVGRDHAGIGNYYGKYEAQKIFDNFKSELGISILKLGGPYYCNYCDAIVTENSCPHCNNKQYKVTHISGTEVRNRLMNNKYISKKIVRPEIIKLLKGIDRLFI